MTLREALDSQEFDWTTGVILTQPVKLNEDGYISAPGWTSDVGPTIQISSSHSLLDQEFDDDYGAPEMPRFVATDKTFIYFPCQYDGST